jgi:hypothetical protein
MANNYTGKNASDFTVTFAGVEYSSVQYPGAMLFLEVGGLPVAVSTTDPLPIVVQDPLPAGSNFIGGVSIDDPIPAGTNNIGDMDILTLPASAATTDTVTVKHDVRNAHDGLTALPYKYAFANATSSGYTSIVSAVADKHIVVLAYSIVVASSVTVNLASASTAITSNKTLGTGMSVPFNPGGYCKTAVNEALRINLTGAVNVGVDVCYVERSA